MILKINALDNDGSLEAWERRLGCPAMMQMPPFAVGMRDSGGWYGVSLYLFIRFLPWGTSSSVGAGDSRGRAASPSDA